MKLGMTMRHSMAQDLSMELEQKMEFLQRCQEQIAQTISDLREAVHADSDTIASSIFKAFLELARDQIRDPAVMGMITMLFADPENTTYLKSHIADFANATVSDFSEVTQRAVIQALDRNSNGGIFIGSDPGSSTTYDNLSKALHDPKAFEREIQRTIEIARSDSRSGASSISGHVGEMHVAKKIAEAVAPHIVLMKSVFEVAFQIKDSQKVPILTSFFREAAILRAVDWELSERITKRFVARFGGVGAKASSGSYRDAMVNTISEFVLVSLGVLDPSLFKRERGEVKNLDVLFCDQNVDDTSDDKMEILSTLRKYDLSTGGAIYWCRWALATGAKPTAKTDEQVRKFMRYTVARDATELLERLGYDSFFEKLREIRAEEPADNRAALYAEALTEAFEHDNFLAYLKGKSSSTWFPALNKFLYQSPKSNL